MLQDTGWHKARASIKDGNCVEVRRDQRTIVVRDSKLGDDSPQLEFSLAEWRAFLDGCEDGEFEPGARGLMRGDRVRALVV